MKPVLFEYNLAKAIFFLCLGGCLVFFKIELVYAHRVNLFAWVEGDTVYVESTFSGGRDVKAGQITVTDPQGTEIFRGTTDENGKISFKAPKKVELKIVLLAGPAHRAEWTIAAREIEMPAAGTTPVPDKGIPVINVIIGMGCIFGLTAIVAYIRRRQKKNLS